MNNLKYVNAPDVNEWVNAHSIALGILGLLVGVTLIIPAALGVTRLRAERETFTSENFIQVQGSVRSPFVTVTSTRSKSCSTYYYLLHFKLENQSGAYSYSLGSTSSRTDVPAGIPAGHIVRCVYYRLDGEEGGEHKCSPDLAEAVADWKSSNRFNQGGWYVLGLAGAFFAFLGSRRLLGFRS